MGRKFIDIAVKAARDAGKYAMSRKNTIKKVSYKGAINLVTDVDKICERMIMAEIRKDCSSHFILSEETSTRNMPAEYRWVVDPIDGTTNFSRGLPIYAVSIALEHNDQTVLGVVYDPERDELFYAEKGRGAWLNKKRIKVSETKGLSHAFLSTGFAYNIRKATLDNIDNFQAFIKRSLAVRRLGAASIDLCYVACGRFDGFWERNLKPWDSAASVLIINEAGGHTTDFSGGCFSNYKGELLSSNGLIHDEMVKVLKSVRSST